MPKLNYELSDIGLKVKSFFNAILPFNRNKGIPKDLDVEFMKRIQPIGGIYPHDNFLTLGDGYQTCIHIYSTPDHIRRHWLYPIFQLKDVVPCVEVLPLNTEKIKKRIDKSYKEYLTRFNENRDNVNEAKDAETKMARLEMLVDEIEQSGNRMLALDIKLIISSNSFTGMEKNVEEIERFLVKKGFATFSRNINEQVNDYVAFYRSPEENNATIYSRQRIPAPADIVAQSLPFYYIGAKDNYGYLLGTTTTRSGDSCVYWDPNYVDKFYRTSYDMLLCGKQGSGKSTMLKTLIEHLIATGNRACVIDNTGEYVKLGRYLEGTVIKMDGSQESERLNPLEILRMGDNETQNYLKHISKLGLMYRLKSPDSKDNEISLFQNMIKKLYIKFGLIESETTQTYTNLTGRDSKEYPIFSDLLKLIESEINDMRAENNTATNHTINVLCHVRDVVNDIVKNYGTLFNGYTTIEEVVNSDLIIYDIHEIAKMGGTVFSMQLFNVLSMAYDSCMSTGLIMKELHDTGKIADRDIVHHLIVCDECQKYINYENPYAVTYMFDVMSQGRKNFIGVALSTQNVSNIYGNSTNNVVTEKIKALFELCQYKLIFNQSSSAKPILEKAFQNILTPEQIDRIPYLAKRELIFVVSPVKTLQLTCKEISAAKLSYFGGGA